MTERYISEDVVARLDFKFIENNDMVRHVFLQQADGTYVDLTDYTAAAPVRAHVDGEEVGDIATGIVDKAAPDGTIRKAVRLRITAAQSESFDRHFWQLDLINPAGEKRTRIAGQLFAVQAQR